MAYHFHQEQLRVFRKFSRQERNREVLKSTRFIINQHLFSNTLVMIKHLAETGAEISAVLAKPYSVQKEVARVLSNMGIPTINKSYHELEGTPIVDELIKSAISSSKVDGKKLMLWDVGGYFSAPLTRISKEDAKLIAGVVEDTTFGHNRYVAERKKIPVPIFSVARSQLKEVEARFVGRDAVAAVDIALRELGITSSGRNALVIGYGMIGKNVARSLQAADFNVHVYDKHDHRNLRAFIDGFRIHKKREIIKFVDVIFAATADVALSYDEIEECKNNVLLASVGSRDTEFDIESMREQALECEACGSHITHFRLPNSKSVYVVREGTAVNFILPGQPEEIMDLVFSEIFISTMLLLKNAEAYDVGEVHALPNSNLNEISKDWLRFVN